MAPSFTKDKPELLVCLHGGPAGVFGGVAQFGFDAQKLVVFGHAV